MTVSGADHAHDFESASFTIDEPLDGDRLQAFFDALPEALLRAKCVMYPAEKPECRTIYQRGCTLALYNW